ncbi:hypothetical protein BC830DRAFT_1072947 [Chytriomyces sp. MP71]|nr:hypothetical protein BC830DRAFT_1072947 [Chytriomyces sp. MP71]
MDPTVPQRPTDQSAPCLNCGKGEIQYECMPCQHATLCKGCAMKQATGGKCKVCSALFSELRKI